MNTATPPPLDAFGAVEFVLGVGVVAALFWILYHLEQDWPVRLVRDRTFRQNAAAIVFAVVLAFLMSDLFF